MKKGMWSNTWFLAAFLLIFSIIFSFLLTYIGSLFNFSALSILSGLLAAMVTGQIFAYKFHDVIEKRQRFHIVLINLVAQFLLVVAYSVMISLILDIFSVLFLLVFSIFYAVVQYFIMGSAGKQILKALRKESDKGPKKAKKKPKKK